MSKFYPLKPPMAGNPWRRISLEGFRVAKVVCKTKTKERGPPLIRMKNISERLCLHPINPLMFSSAKNSHPNVAWWTTRNSCGWPLIESERKIVEMCVNYIKQSPDCWTKNMWLVLNSTVSQHQATFLVYTRNPCHIKQTQFILVK